MIGQIIANYKILSLLGEGGMGTVYLAEHLKLGRKVAIKSLHLQFVNSAEIRARFINEAKIMAGLQHSNIVTLYDYVEDVNALYLIMELVDGRPIDDYIEQVSGPIEETSAIMLMTEILEGFQYAHDKGLVHRDIKPSNLIVSTNNKVKILDFGIAKLVGDAGSKMTKTGTQIGTVYYMSPEQVKGDELDHRSDIYSLGVTFFQMLTGSSPYKGMTKEFEVFMKIVNEDLPDPRTLYPGVSDHMCAIITKATARDVNERFQSCDEFAAALKDESIVALNDKEFDSSSELFSANLNGQKDLNSESNISTRAESNKSSEKKVSGIKSNQISNKSSNDTATSKINKNKYKLFGLISAMLLIVCGILIFNVSKKDAVDKSVATNPANKKPKIVIPTEKAEQLVVEKVEPISSEPKQLTKEKQQEVEKTKPIVSSLNLKIGQKHQGGIIFYLDNSGEHGKVCTERNLGNFNWDMAMEECRNLSLNGFNDWYLASPADFNLIDNLNLTTFLEDWWTSSHASNNQAWAHSNIGGDYKDDRLSSYNVKAVRIF